MRKFEYKTNVSEGVVKANTLRDAFRRVFLNRDGVHGYVHYEGVNWMRKSKSGEIEEINPE